MRTDIDALERAEQKFRQRYHIKKTVNIIICALITALGVFSVIYIWNYDGEGLLTFRWMTVDGTIFTTLISFAYVIISLVELIGYTELTSRAVYYMRLASAVAEALILTVVMISQMPFSPQHMHILRCDMFLMHILIPVLTVLSFTLNDSPAGKLSIRKIFNGTWFVTLYAVTLITLILSGVITQEQIPYFFLDIAHMPPLAVVGCFILTYALGFALSALLYRLNRKLSWLWFKKVAKK